MATFVLGTRRVRRVVRAGGHAPLPGEEILPRLREVTDPADLAGRCPGCTRRLPGTPAGRSG